MRIGADLEAALQSKGWDALYEEHIPDLAPPNAKGERRAFSPFPDIADKTTPSFTLNSNTGVWKCFKSDRGGNYIKFRAILDAEDYDPATGLAIEDYGKAQRTIAKELGVTKAIDPAFVEECRLVLYHDLAVQHQLATLKPWNAAVMYNLGVGFSVLHQKFTFPVYGRNGELINVRLYRPGSTPKFVWLEANSSANAVWPHIGWKERQVILVEGETDVLSLRSLGFPAISGTMGAGLPVPDGEWFRGKHIYIWTDDDPRGREALLEATRRVRDLAAEVFQVTLPDWPGKPEKADQSDYIMYLRSLGYEIEQQQRAISDLLVNAEKVETVSQIYDNPPTDLSFSNALNAEYLNNRIRFTSRITAKSSTRHVLPTMYSITCPAEGHSYCKTCPMNNQFHGNARFTHDPRSKDSLKLIQTSDLMQIQAYKDLHGIAKACPEPRATTIQAVDVESVMLNSSMFDTIAESESSVERTRREAYVIVPSGQMVEENRDYTFDGFMYAHPKTQQSVFLIDKLQPHISTYENFQPDESTLLSLAHTFQPVSGQSVIDKLLDVSNDLINSTTLIYGRQDLHLAYRTVWHSVLRFKLAGRTVDRGWLECLVLGDTRCGKSEAFRQLSNYYGMGTLIDCKMQSIPGILGTVVQSSTGEYYVVAGLLPQQDGRVVCFDEFTVPRGQGQSIIEVLSSTRSEGVVRISKAASAEFRARVRSIWLANPGGGKLIAESADSGIELINRLIPQPEDIARFDLALTVAQQDVPAEIINALPPPTTPKYSQEMARTLLAWTYSRKADQIHFTTEAEAAVMDLAMRMIKRYSSTIPLVEVADQRTRVAKVAISIAAQVFSTDSTGQNIVVDKKHVDCAEQMFSIWYDKPAMGYLDYSQRIQSDHQLLDEQSVLNIFTETAGVHGRRLAEELLRLDQFTERTFGTIVPMEGMFTRTLLQTLYLNRAVHLTNRGKTESYEKTTAFTSFLKRYLANAQSLN